MTVQLAQRRRQGWTGELWDAIEPTHLRILEHPFITGLTTGELAPDAFLRFLAQDTYYVNEYARSLAALSSTAPTMALTRSLLEHASGAVAAESTLHAELVAMLGGPPDLLARVVPSPTAAAYVDFVTARVHTGSFFTGLAAVLPCMWVYAEVGVHLVASGSSDPAYQRWIDNYAGSGYLEEVDRILDDVDALAQVVGGEERARAAEVALTATRYEWMFWDAAYAGEQWPSLP
ncbi:TenA family protein [Nocardioides sp. L-11A]|uniref:TenA family protein n=1 Tax=Nocardioides sp. L-11A TaxID=3043848 RepID=UPI00249CC42F|nr:TenA family protein [Nocardioides sp. L-11A]